MTDSFFKAMAGEPDAIAILEREVDTLRTNQSLILADRPDALILATRSLPGSLYEGLTKSARVGRPISYAMFAHSSAHLPGLEQTVNSTVPRFDDRWPPVCDTLCSR